MRIGDYEEIVLLWEKTDGIQMRDADSKEGILKYLNRNPGLNFVALSDGVIIGTIMAGHDGKRGYIQHLSVSELQRNKGTGTALVETCLAALKMQGIEKSHIHILSNNDAAKQFWVNRGWFARPDIQTYSYINGANKNT